MDPLEYFDEEYQRFNKSVSDINSLIIQSRDNYFKIAEVQKKLNILFANNELSPDSVKSALTLLEDLMRNSKDLLSVVESSYNIIDNLKNK
jgi:hypothetical protein